MTREITIKVTAPIEFTNEQVKEWLEFQLCVRGSITTSNPLHEFEIIIDEISID